MERPATSGDDGAWCRGEEHHGGRPEAVAEARAVDDGSVRRGSTYADGEDSAEPASPAAASSSTDARAAACSDSALACHAAASPRRRTSRSSSSTPRRAGLRKVLPAPVTGSDAVEEDAAVAEVEGGV